MEQFRYVAALLVVLTVPPALVYWFTIHPLVHFWRRAGVKVAYPTLVLLVSAVGAIAYIFRDELLGTDFGTNLVLFIPGAAVFIIAAIIGINLARNFTIRTLLGVPELRGESSPDKLVTKGIYSRIRHPRYLSVFLGLAGISLMANYLGAYVLTVIFVPGLWLLILLEERELAERFGEQYREYCKTVPRFIPR